MKVILLTGLPGVGKTTTINRLCSHYSAKGIGVQGIITREIRERGERVGFSITDLSTSQEGWLARRDSAVGPRVGSYHVVSEDLERIGVAALERAVDTAAALVVLDEIGPMEMTSASFRKAVAKVLNQARVTVATLKYGSHYTEVEAVRKMSMQLEITRDNRDEIYHKLLEEADHAIGKSQS